MHIYKITNQINNKVYVGQTIQKNPTMRWYAHLADARNGKKSYLYDSIRKYGKENFSWEIIQEANSIEELNVLETYWADKLKADGYTIIGYGAAAKGNTLLNYIDTPLDLIIDDSPLKQNLYAPGTNSPIKSIDALKELSKDTKILFMPLAWNFFTEISKRIKAVRNEPQDKFLKYFPNVEVV